MLTDKLNDIKITGKRMTSDEIITLIFKDVDITTMVEMSEDLAMDIIFHPSYKMFPHNLTDWAWNILDN